MSAYVDDVSSIACVVNSLVVVVGDAVVTVVVNGPAVQMTRYLLIRGMLLYTSKIFTHIFIPRKRQIGEI